MNSPKHLFVQLFALFLCLTLGMGGAMAQNNESEQDYYKKADKFYISTGGEMIFSWSDTQHPTSNEGVVIRWAPVFNFQSIANYDLGKAFGLTAGLALRNIGYIYQFNNADGAGQSFRKKFRTYNLAIPLGIKIGNMDKFHIYGGYDFEFPFHYKETTYNNNDGSDKTKITSWFSDRTERVQHAVHLGFQSRGGFNLKFKYYLNNFHNEEFTNSTGDLYPPSGISNEPYKGVISNVFYVSLSVMIDKKSYSYYKSRDWWDWDE